MTKLSFGKKGVTIRGPKKKIGDLKGKMITIIGFLGSSRCFLIPNMTKLSFGKKKGHNQGTEKN